MLCAPHQVPSGQRRHGSLLDRDLKERIREVNREFIAQAEKRPDAVRLELLDERLLEFELGVLGVQVRTRRIRS
jgi:hypothetical protein